MISSDLSRSKKTKKIRRREVDSKKIWGIFQDEFKNTDDIECVYDKNNYVNL